MPGATGPCPQSDEVLTEVDRIADRVRTLSLARLGAPVPGHLSRADQVRAVAGLLARAGQGVEERTAAAQPSWRVLPRLTERAAGDLLAVTGHDLGAAAAGLAPATEVWAPDGGRAQLIDVLDRCLQALVDLRHAL